MTGMLEKKVIVISGVGPGLGTTLAHPCAPLHGQSAGVDDLGGG